MKEEEEQKDVGDVIKDAFVPREYEPPNVKNPNVEHKSELQEIQESIFEKDKPGRWLFDDYWQILIDNEDN